MIVIVNIIFLLLILFVVFKILENRIFVNLIYTLRRRNHEDAIINYKDETFSLKDTEIYSEYSSRFDFSKHSLYFGDFDQGVEHIEINMPAKLKVYPIEY